ncbi:hypothetical protein AMST5_03971 [freshwater sediment metagenome]|uniref:Uncharacterized protein n=1 Tax=freshwater sediment metagenome TaxID=556182 RepID=A0AA48RBZ2_9ZZZZ
MLRGRRRLPERQMNVLDTHRSAWMKSHLPWGRRESIALSSSILNRSGAMSTLRKAMTAGAIATIVVTSVFASTPASAGAVAGAVAVAGAAAAAAGRRRLGPRGLGRRRLGSWRLGRRRLGPSRLGRRRLGLEPRLGRRRLGPAPLSRDWRSARPQQAIPTVTVMATATTMAVASPGSLPMTPGAISSVTSASMCPATEQASRSEGRFGPAWPLPGHAGVRHYFLSASAMPSWAMMTSRILRL